MRSFLQSLFRKRLIQHPDTFAMTRDNLWASIARSIRLQQSMRKQVWLVAHFPDTYIACQEMLEEYDIDYFVETDSVSESWVLQRTAAASPHVRLFLGDLVKPLAFEEDMATSDSKIALMAVERHPFKPMDDRVVGFAKSLPAKVEIGYFLALDDELVKRLVPEQMIDLLKAMGLKDYDLITSSLVTRRLSKLIDRTSETANSGDGDESALAWFQMQDG